MSKFLVNNNDLDNIFMSRSTSGATGAPYLTNFISSGQDLQLRYAAYVYGTPAGTTHYTSSNYSDQDLNQIFQNKNVPLVNYVATGTNFTDVPYGSNGREITWKSGTGTIIFYVQPNLINTGVINFIPIVGGGSGGNGGTKAIDSSHAGSGGNGGKGGEQWINVEKNVILGLTYTITVGVGGAVGSSNGGIGGLGTDSSVVTVATELIRARGNWRDGHAGGAGGTGSSTGTTASGAEGASTTDLGGAGGGGGSLNQQARVGGTGGATGCGDGGGANGKNTNTQFNGLAPTGTDIGSSPGGGGGGGGGGGVYNTSTLGNGGAGSSGRGGICTITFSYPPP
jgi:hypothetical protein